MTDEQLIEEFLAKGIVKLPVENSGWISNIKTMLENECGELNTFHLREGKNNLNDTRLRMIQLINQKYHKHYFSLAKHAIETLVGNELVMQRNINLSIQLPGDDSSLLPIHCDTWSGDSPYEVVLWVPLVDVYDTKSMFFVDKEWDAMVQPNMGTYQASEDLWNAVKDHAQFMKVNYGECLIFTQNIMHGNRVNETNETRWSMNCRFKSALTPYVDKKLGEFFEPVTVRPATRLGASYVTPRL